MHKSITCVRTCRRGLSGRCGWGRLVREAHRRLVRCRCAICQLVTHGGDDERSVVRAQVLDARSIGGGQVLPHPPVQVLCTARG